jgi:hypothetical protein
MKERDCSRDIEILNNFANEILKTKASYIEKIQQEPDLVLYVGHMEYYYIRKFGHLHDELLFKYSANNENIRWLDCEIVKVNKNGYFHLILKCSALNLLKVIENGNL